MSYHIYLCTKVQVFKTHAGLQLSSQTKLRELLLNGNDFSLNFSNFLFCQRNTGRDRFELTKPLLAFLDFSPECRNSTCHLFQVLMCVFLRKGRALPWRKLDKMVQTFLIPLKLNCFLYSFVESAKCCACALAVSISTNKSASLWQEIFIVYSRIEN